MNKTLKSRRILLYIIVFILSLNSILQIDAYFEQNNLSSIPSWIITGFSFSLVLLILVLDKRLPFRSIRINTESVFFSICIILFYLTLLPGLLLSKGSNVSLREYMFWIYTIVLFSYGGVVGLYLQRRINITLSAILLVLISLLFVDLNFYSFTSYLIDPRAAGTLRNPNTAAYVAVLLMVASLHYPVWKLSIVNVIFIVITGVGIVLTASFGGTIAYISVLSSIIILSYIKRSSRLKFPLIVLPLLIVPILILIYFVINNKLGITLSNFNVNKILNSGSIIERIEVAKVTLGLLSQQPLFGHGIFYVYSMELGPHNMLLRILIEGGLLGFVGLFVLLGGLFWVAFKRKSYKFLLLTIALIAMGSTTHTVLESRSIIFISGVVFSSSRINRSRLLDSKINKEQRV